MRDMVVRFAALSAAVAIGAGAFGAHAASGQAIDWLRIGAMYQLVHATAAILVVSLDRRAAMVLLVGAAIFAFSLYAMAVGGPRWLGAVTPVGGLAMISGWLMIAFRPR